MTNNICITCNMFSDFYIKRLESYDQARNVYHFDMPPCPLSTLTTATFNIICNQCTASGWDLKEFVCDSLVESGVRATAENVELEIVACCKAVKPGMSCNPQWGHLEAPGRHWITWWFIRVVMFDLRLKKRLILRLHFHSLRFYYGILPRPSSIPIESNIGTLMSHQVYLMIHQSFELPAVHQTIKSNLQTLMTHQLSLKYLMKPSSILINTWRVINYSSESACCFVHPQLLNVDFIYDDDSQVRFSLGKSNAI